MMASRNRCVAHSESSRGPRALATVPASRPVAALALGCAVALATAALSSGAAHAQIAAAMGKPLPDGSLEPGSVTVRVFEGSPQKPVVGTDVLLVSPDGEQRTARTDAEGRATFAKLPAGGQFVAAVAARSAQGETPADGEPEMVRSEPFTIPDTGGLRLMLSTVPFAGAGAGAGGPVHAGGPMAGPAGMPDPRQMSGVPRPERVDPLGTLTVRVAYGSMETKARAIGQLVHLVAFQSGGAVSVTSKRTEEDGRVTFEGLKPRGTAYYVMTVLERDNGTLDRLRSETIVMPHEVGVRVMLAGHPRDSTEPPIDDLNELVPQGAAGPAGTLVVRIDGTPERIDQVELLRLVEGGEPTAVANAPVRPAVPNPGDVAGVIATPEPIDALAAGSIMVGIRRALPPQGDAPLAATEIEVWEVSPTAPTAPPAPPTDATAAPVQVQTSSASGLATFTGLAVGKTYKLVAVVHGKRIESAPFALPADSGVSATATVQWRVYSRVEARFTGIEASPDAVYMARIRHAGNDYDSAPLQLTRDRGAATVVIVYPPRVVTRFHMSGQIDDEYMGFQVQFSLHNMSHAPYDPGPAGLLLPLPLGFKGAVVAEEFQDAIKVDPDRGLIWRGAVPPGGVQFIAGFSLTVDDGGFEFDMPLPYGAFQSSLVMSYTPGMRVDMPAGVQHEVRKLENGLQFFVVRQIDIRAGQSMVFSVSGLPEEPAWKRHSRLAVGLGVVALLVLAIALLVLRRRDPALDAAYGTTLGAAGAAELGQTGSAGKTRKLERRREQLLEELVALEGKKQRGDIDGPSYQRGKDKLMGKLEAVYSDLSWAKHGNAGARASGARRGANAGPSKRA